MTKKKTQVWTEGVVPDSVAEYNRRKANTKHRRKAIPKTNLVVRVKLDIFNAIDEMAVRYDVPVARILHKFVEDGILTYGNKAEIEMAKLKCPTPFDDIPEDPGEYVMKEENRGEHAELPPASVPPYKPKRTHIPGMVAGKPIERGDIN